MVYWTKKQDFMAALHNNSSLNLFWFRRDLRISDNHGLYQALKDGPTICCFIWDKNILGLIKSNNPRVEVIRQSLQDLKQQLRQHNSDLLILHDTTMGAIDTLLANYPIKAVYANEDYEPAAIKRDAEIARSLSKKSVDFSLHKDQVIFAKKEVLNKAGAPYTVFTPYKKAWLQQLANYPINNYDCTPYLANIIPVNAELSAYDTRQDFPVDLGFKGGESAANERLAKFIDNLDYYDQTRDFPTIDSTSHLGTDLRFGTISVRKLVQLALSRHSKGADTWLSELIWREFFSQILYNFPHVVTAPFRREYTQLKYQFNPLWWESWCNGQTGFPIVNAGMRQLKETGFMHNRVRMICASFLCKDLLIDWRLGEKYFAEHLLDYDLASNNGNWQWCASTGCDAQPYFRIFNPYNQSQKFDPEGKYIRRYVPELRNLDSQQIHTPPTDNLFAAGDYPQPIVNHQTQSKLAKILFADLKQGLI